MGNWGVAVFFSLLLSLVFALVIGTASALWATARTFRSSVRNGPWLYNPLVGSQAANAYLRAAIAKIGLLALDKSEAVYLIATQDNDGNPLSGSATYRIEGTDLATRWWSLTAYGADCFLVPNPLNRYSYNSANLDRSADGSYRIYASAAQQSGNWIPVEAGRPFDLTLRLYNPSPVLLKKLSVAPLPRIIRESVHHA